MKIPLTIFTFCSYRTIMYGLLLPVNSDTGHLTDSNIYYQTCVYRCIVKYLNFVSFLSISFIIITIVIIVVVIIWSYTSVCICMCIKSTACLKKLCQLIFLHSVCQICTEPISIKIGRIVPEETLNKTVPKRPLHLKYVPALPWEIWSARLSRQRSNYM